MKESILELLFLAAETASLFKDEVYVTRQAVYRLHAFFFSVSKEYSSRKRPDMKRDCLVVHVIRQEVKIFAKEFPSSAALLAART